MAALCTSTYREILTMGNLGGYQTAVQLIKALGGPKKAVSILLPVTMVLGYGLLRPVEAGGKKAVAKVRDVQQDRRAARAEADRIFTVETDATADEEPVLRVGDQFRILQRDDDVVLVELIGDSNNPYVLSAEHLHSISDFPDGPDAHEE